MNDLGLDLLYYEDLILEGQTLEISNKNIEVRPDSVYSFCYTSGTTGLPKGALITHENLLAAISTFSLHKDLAFGSEDTYLSYLPLPHLMERTISNVMFLSGAFLVYYIHNIGFQVETLPK